MVRMIIYLIIIVAILFGVVSVFRIQSLRVSKIAVKGNTSLGSENLGAAVLSQMSGNYISLFPRDSIFLYDKNNIKRELLKDFPQIYEASLETNFPKSLTLTVEERVTYGLFCEDEKCAFVDSNGEVFQMAPNYSDGVYLTFVPLGTTTVKKIENDFKKFNLLPESEFLDLKEFLSQLRKIGVHANKVAIGDEGNYEIYTRKGWYIILAKSANLDAAVGNLNILLKEKIKKGENLLDYVDLRFGNKIFYKFRE